MFSVDDIAAQNGVSIVGLHFLNFYIDKYESIYGYSLIWANSLLLLGCKFSGTVASDVGYPVLLYLRRGTLATCSFNVKLSDNAILLNNSPYVVYFNYTNVIIDNSDYVGSISCPLYVTSADSFLSILPMQAELRFIFRRIKTANPALFTPTPEAPSQL